MALYEGRLGTGPCYEVVVAGAAAAVSNTSLALVAVLVLDSDVRAAGLLVVLAAILFLAYRAYASLTQGYARLELLYGFTGAVGRSVQPEAVLRTVLPRPGTCRGPTPPRSASTAAGPVRSASGRTAT